MATVSREPEAELDPVYHQYTPHRAGLPPLVPYFRELWQRRGFAVEMSRANMRGANIATLLGQAWLVLNPLLLAGVYYLLVTIIRQRADPDLFLHLTLGLFAFNFVTTAITTGAISVTTSGRLLINTAFPRLLIPLSAVRTAFYRFLPTYAVYLVFHLIFNRDYWHPRMLLAAYFLLTMTVFGMGLAALFAAVQVYFRDLRNFLPYLMRIWLYVSPILWMPSMLERFDNRALLTLVELNPMYAMLTGYTDLLLAGRFPETWTWWASGAWALAAAVIGFLFFISREREFAVRLV